MLTSTRDRSIGLLDVCIEEKWAYTCDVCGFIPAGVCSKQINGKKLYYKKNCRCSQGAIERLKTTNPEMFETNEDIRRRQQSERRKYLRDVCYSVLGSQEDSSEFYTKTFENYTDKSSEAYMYVKDGAYNKIQRNVLLHGNYGSKKTHLIAAYCNYLASIGEKVMFLSAPRVFAQIQKRIASGLDGYSVYEPYCLCDWLVIDDIDSTASNEYRREVYYQVLDSRDIRKLGVIITASNAQRVETHIGEGGMYRFSKGLKKFLVDGREGK